MRFSPLFSSSSGNSAYIGTSSCGILIDAGANCKQLTLALEDIGVEPSSIRAIFITHEHSDHISALRVFAKKYGCQVYASPETLKRLQKHGHLEGVKDSFGTDSEVEVGGLVVTPFHTSHDSVESLGYSVTDGDRKITIISDTGEVTPAIMRAAEGSDLVMIESNHDPDMLKWGPYPPELKARIRSKIGHLSNGDCSEAVLELYNSGTTRFVLSHLSAENNKPELAYDESLKILQNAGAVLNKDFTLTVAEIRTTAKKYITI